MATRARKILELVVKNTTTNYEFDTAVPISGDKHKNNDTNDASHELLNENCVSIQMENESTVEGRTITESVNYVDKENEVTILSGGAILCGATSWSLIRISYYFWVTDLGVELASSVLYICGALLCLPTCWLATLVPYQPRTLSLSATLLILASTAMVVLGLGMSSMPALSHALRERTALNASLRHALGSPDPAVQSAFAALQIELRCCGVESYSDWYPYRPSLPASCCGRVSKAKSVICDASILATGCLHRALGELRAYVNSITILASVIVVILAVTLFAGAYTLVSGVLGRSELAGKAARPACIAAVAAPQLPHLAHLTHLTHFAPPSPDTQYNHQPMTNI